jgi:hypothetical protein
MPTRIQRTRLKGAKLPPNTICVTRPGRFSNPYKIGELNHDTGERVTPGKCLDYFEYYLRRRYPGEQLREFLDPLREADHIACWCKTSAPCHGDILLKLMRETA